MARQEKETSSPAWPENFSPEIQRVLDKTQALLAKQWQIETEVDENIPVGTEKPVDKSLLNTIRNLALSVETVKECKDIGMISVNDELHKTHTIKI